MDLAPAFPPSQETTPVLVSDATDLPPDSLSPNSTFSDSTFLDSQSSSSPDGLDIKTAGVNASDESEGQLSFLPELPTLQPLVHAVGPAATKIPPALMASVANLKRQAPSAVDFLSASQLTRSFHFVGQAWRSARMGSWAAQPVYSAAVPIQWAQNDNWKLKALAANIQVTQVNVTAQTAQLENSHWAAAFSRQCLQGTRREFADGMRYKLSLGDKTLGYVADADRAYLLAQQLKRLVRQAGFDPEAIAPYPVSENALATPANQEVDVMVGTPSQALFAIDNTMAEDLGYSKQWAAVAWANNLRHALEAEPLKVGDAHKSFLNLQASKISMTGDASWYGPYFHGRATANGETYNQNDLTVAHKSLPFGTQLEVRNLVNGKTVVVRVNDRGPYVGDRILDLSKAAADCLGSDEAGVIPVEATVLKKAQLPALAPQ